MGYGLLLLTALVGSGTTITVGFYNQKSKNVYLFGLVAALLSVLFFCVTAKFSFDFQWITFWYAMAYGVCYTCAMLFSLVAVKYGSISLTSLMMSYSLVVPTVFAIFAYGEDPLWTFYVGALLLVISLFFVGVPRKKGEAHINPKWVFIIALAFFGNGGCSILQTHYQRVSGGLHRSEFMIMGSLLYIVVCVIGTIVCRKKETPETAKVALLQGGLNGLANAGVNILTMILVGIMAASLVYPLKSALDMIFSVLACRIFFKEKPDKLTLLGLITGIVSIVFLNITM